ncbi:hypothetical protein PENTCL1PPCAC_2893, partial [Pristionchus entomophagus]
IVVDQNQSDFPAPSSHESPEPLSSNNDSGHFVPYKTLRRKRKRTYGLDSDPLQKPLKFFDLVDNESSLPRFRRAPSADSMDVDVSTDSIEVSDEPLFEPSIPQPDVGRGDIFLDNRSGEICMSTLSFAMLILTTVLIILIVSLIYWIYAFRRSGTSGRITRFVENYWIETEAANQDRYRYS